MEDLRLQRTAQRASSVDDDMQVSCLAQLFVAFCNLSAVKKYLVFAVGTYCSSIKCLFKCCMFEHFQVVWSV